jgi:Methyltransferase domain
MPKQDRVPETRKATEIISFPDMEHHAGSVGFIEKMIIGELLIVAQPKLVIETGVYRGFTTKFVCEFLKNNGQSDCRIVAFDRPDVVQELQRDPYFAAEQKIELVGGALPASLKKHLQATEQMIDFAIVDADHSYRGVTGDLKALAPHIRPGGYIFAHDYRTGDPEYKELISAVDHFALTHGFSMLPLNPTPFGTQNVWGSAILRKPDGDQLSLSNHLYHKTLGRVISRFKCSRLNKTPR